MKTKKLNYNVGLTGVSIYKIVAAVVFFAILANIINLGAFYRGNSVELNVSSLFQSEIKLSKVFNKIKILGNLFKTGKTSSDDESDIVQNNGKVSVIVQQNKKFSAELSKKNLYIPINELKIFSVTSPYISQNYPFKHVFFNSDFIMTLLLILLLMSVLPRGIPLRNKKNINMFTHPVFM